MTETKTVAIQPFDPNEDASGFRLPSAESAVGVFGKAGGLVALDAQGYAAVFERAFSKDTDMSFENGLSKALSATPQINTFARITYMPDQVGSNLLAWPGISPESLMKIVRENVAPQLIIGMRQDDLMRYAQLSTHPWRPGWQIETIEQKPDGPDESERKRIREAERFLENCNIETNNTQARKRDEKRITDFMRFLSALVRDTLTLDLIAIWTDMDQLDRVKAFSVLPGSRMRYAGPGGYMGDKTKYAAAVDEGGTVKHTFTRDQVTIYHRNIREEIESLGYGFSEVEMAVRLIQGFQNAIDLNCDTFNRSAIPNGILVLSGEQVTQKQLDLLNRMWTNLKKGITKAWALPVIGMAGKDSKIEVLNLNDLKGMEVFYQDFMNMIAGMFCTIYRFPVHRLGYRISGKGKDSEPLPDPGNVAAVDEDDTGLAPLLSHIENLLNQYVLWTRYPDLRFRFNGKSPREDAREYEAKKLARTWKEERAEAGLPPLLDLLKKSDAFSKAKKKDKKKPKPTPSKDAGGEDAAPAPKPEKSLKTKLKELCQIMELAPADSAKQGIFQSLAQALVEPEPAPGEGAGPGARMGSKKDPALAEQHGHTSGVRRDSSSEKTSAGAK